jgi:hypothetical protein
MSTLEIGASLAAVPSVTEWMRFCSKFTRIFLHVPRHSDSSEWPFVFLAFKYSSRRFLVLSVFLAWCCPCFV